MKNRYQGRGGRYVAVGNEVFPAAEDGVTPLPHDPSVPDVPDADPAPIDPPTDPAGPDPTE